MGLGKTFIFLAKLEVPNSYDFFSTQTSLQDSGFNERSRRSSSGSGAAASTSASSCGKENASPNKRARKSLAANWAPQSLCRADDSSFANPETPSKSLLGTDSSLIFTPPSILKDTLNHSDDSGNGDVNDSSAGGHQQQSPAVTAAGAAGSQGQQGQAAKQAGEQGLQADGAKAHSQSTAQSSGESPPKSKVRTIMQDYLMIPLCS